jgi:hypothetical protein
MVSDKVLAVAAAGLIGLFGVSVIGGVVAITVSQDTPRPYYSLIQTLPDGNDYVMDYNLTSGDCVQRRETSAEVLIAFNGDISPRSLVCAEQPQGRIIP